MSDEKKLTVTLRLSWAAKVFFAAVGKALGVRGFGFVLGWALLLVGSALAFGVGVGMLVGGACLFAVSVFGVAPSGAPASPEPGGG